MVVIEESNDLSTMRKEDLQSYLKAYEKIMKERNVNKKKVDISL